jgi:hypothetical protein
VAKNDTADILKLTFRSLLAALKAILSG